MFVKENDKKQEVNGKQRVKTAAWFMRSILNLICGSRPLMQGNGEIVFSIPEAASKAMAEHLKDRKKQKIIVNSNQAIHNGSQHLTDTD